MLLYSEGIWWAGACDLDQRGNGCRIDNGACSCSYGCKSEYRYATRKECLDALKVRQNSSLFLIDYSGNKKKKSQDSLHCM